MSTQEILILRGRLAEAKNNAAQQATRISALKRSIRAELDPYREPLDTDVLGAADQMQLLLKAHADYSETVALMARLKKDLGE